jgi:hypothetical protein
MLSQPESRFMLHQVMEEQRILIVNLSMIGPEQRNMLGRFMLSLLHITTLTRSRIPPELRKPFNIYGDESQRLTTDSIEEMFVEMRKYKVSMTVAHHFLAQFPKKQMDALFGTGATIIFRVDAGDAGILSKNLMGKIAPEELTSLADGTAVAHIGPVVVRIATPVPREIPESNCRDRIVALSRERYYLPANQVRALIERRRGTRPGPFSCRNIFALPEDFPPDSNGTPGYDEF